MSNADTARHITVDAVSPSEPDQVPTARHPGAARRQAPRWLGSLMARYALLLVWAAMALYFWIRVPHLFGTHAAFSSIFGSQQTLVFLGMAILVTSVAGEIDLSVASIMGVTATAIPVLVTDAHWPLPLACVAGIALALVIGAVNAFFVVFMNVSSFVVTLGMGTFLIGFAQAISHTQVVSLSSAGLSRLATYPVLGLPISFYYGVALALAIAYFIAWTPAGRAVVFVGANREVARLAGIRVNRIRFVSYVVGALLAGIAGFLLVATVGGFDSSLSMTFLMPALAAVFLGTAVVVPGTFNPIGTLVAVYFLQTGIFGLQLLGYSGWIQNAFYGAGLVVAVAISNVVRERAKQH